jgi:lipoyl(octanoyl) transferase
MGFGTSHNWLIVNQRSASGDGAWQMALDEILWKRTEQPIFRAYRWSEPTVTFGYFLDLKTLEIPANFSGPVVRRWTGGGLVMHDHDLPYSLIVPKEAALAALRPAESYQQIHAALAAAMREQHFPAILGEAESGSGLACFTHPVRADVLCGGQKIAGAAQRRTRTGFLHQGSIQGLPAGRVFDEISFLASFIDKLGGGIAWEIPSDWLQEAEILAQEKYRTDAWLRNRSIPGCKFPQNDR